MDKRSTEQVKKSNITISVIVFILALITLFGASYGVRQIRLDMEHQELRLLAVSTANKITKVITDRIWKAETLATLIVQGDGHIEDFEKVAAILVNDPSVLNVSLAPGGKVSQIFPLKGNEAVIGLDYLNSGGASEARWAQETGKLTLAGPFNLIQGGQAVTGRLPVYLKDGSMWGFVGIALAYPDVLHTAFLEELFQQGFTGEIWRINPATSERQIIWKSHQSLSLYGALVESREVGLFNVTWNVSVARTGGTHNILEYWLVVFCILGCSLLLAMLTYHYLELRNMKAALENLAMTDTLTGLPNRRNIMMQLQRIIDDPDYKRNPFVILYMDLNGFKQVNDSRGHDVGDYVLRKASQILLKNVGTEGIVSRVGGDEFIVVLKGYTRSERLEQLIARLDEALHIYIDALDDKPELEVSGSFGVSYYPNDGRELKLLLHAADLRMYNTKKIKRDTAILAGKSFKNHFR